MCILDISDLYCCEWIVNVSVLVWFLTQIGAKCRGGGMMDPKVRPTIGTEMEVLGFH